MNFVLFLDLPIISENLYKGIRPLFLLSLNLHANMLFSCGMSRREYAAGKSVLQVSCVGWTIDIYTCDNAAVAAFREPCIQELVVAPSFLLFLLSKSQKCVRLT